MRPDIHDAMGAAVDIQLGGNVPGGGRALLEDVKAITRGAAARKLEGHSLASAAKAVLVVEDLRKARGETKDPAQQKEIDTLINELTARFKLAGSGQKAMSPGALREQPRASATAVHGENREAQLLASWIRQAEDTIAFLERTIPRVADAREREDLGRIAANLRLQYGITKEFPAPAPLFGAASPERTRESIGRGMDELEALVVRMPESRIRQEAEAMIRRVRDQYGLSQPKS